MIYRLVKATFLAATLAAVLESLPDVQRYFDIREM